jgi:outer membrane protein assembly factor BamE (lipoprotein component of BamABCDE complex)
MNSLLRSALHATVLASTLFLLPALASAKDPAADRASQLLAATGTLPLKAAGPYVEAGTFRIQVSAKLGRPTARLADGTWLYENFSAQESAAAGTLVVRFNADGRVGNLALVTQAVALALSAPKKPAGTILVAAGHQR